MLRTAFVYRPDDNADGSYDTGQSFILEVGVKIYGHFAGNETSTGQRNLSSSTYETVLSGDLEGNDTNMPTCTQDSDCGTNVRCVDGLCLRGLNSCAPLRPV